MRIVMDTEVVLRGFFFGGPCRRIVEAVVRGKLASYATPEIVAEYGAAMAKIAAEYEGAAAKNAARKPVKLHPNLLLPLTTSLRLTEAPPAPPACRYAGYNKFLSCALSANAVYIVTDLRDLKLTRRGKRVSFMAAKGLRLLLSLCD